VDLGPALDGARLPDGRPAAASWPVAAGILIGAAADALLGDPRRGHPVALFGRAAAAAEARAYTAAKARGAAYTAACVLTVAVPAALVSRLARRWLPRRPAALALLTVTGATGWACLGAASLAAEAERLAAALEAGDLAAARAVLPSLCGRDPAGLDESGLARAAVESVAENTCDAAVAPLLWGAVAGPAGLAAYRAANTLDAMVGYRTERYRDFGWASARLDDVAGAVPARLTGALAAFCAAAAGGRPGHALRAMLRDGAHHPSPNAGRCEAAFAGALGVRLGGTNVYAGATEYRPEMGDGRPPAVADIRRAVRLSRAVTWAAAALAAAIALAPDPMILCGSGHYLDPTAEDHESRPAHPHGPTGSHGSPGTHGPTAPTGPRRLR
jgi:adenosylcobinamide-phosphate synthase